ncbi:MAG: isocitrate/isopropylmalate family dehydrogenase [Candidatus Limnocylindrales bacterium]
MTDRAPTYRIVAIPGDGVGPEVVNATVSVLNAAARTFGFTIDWEMVRAGGVAIDASGVAILDEDIERCAAAHAVLLGAVGGPRWDDPTATVRPEQALFALRGSLGLFANLRPVTIHPAIAAAAAPVKAELLEGVDLLIIRELTGGLYFGERSEASGEPGARTASDTLPYSEPEIRRVVRLAFELARTRRGRLTSVDKANVLATSRLWRAVVEDLRSEFPDVEVSHQLVDLVRDAARQATGPVRCPRDREPVRRHPLGRGERAGRVARAPAVGVARRTPHGARPVRDVRTDPRIRAGHRRQGHREPDRHDPVRGDAAALVARSRRRGPGDRGGRHGGPRRGLADG